MAARKTQRAATKRASSKTSVLRYAPKDVQIPKRLGGGVLKELVEQAMPAGVVRRYALAYINPAIFSGDNGRVLGYDSAHDSPHRHHMGVVTPEPFVSWVALREKLESEWRAIALAFVNGEKP